MNKKGIVGFVIIFVCSLIILGLIIGLNGIHIITTREGKHTGAITAIETNGIIFKTTSVYFKTDPESSQEDRYCLIDKSLIPQLEKYSKDKIKITINYIDYFYPSWRECKEADEGIIIKVEEGES